MTVNYTIIIPHKNIPELLKRCLSNIPQRLDIQVIVIDDNSDPDKKPIIGRPNTEIYYLDKEQSKGAGKARNVGLKLAKGTWLIFADADDYFTYEFWNQLDFLVGDENNADVIYCKVASVYSDTGQSANRGSSYNMLVDNYLHSSWRSEDFLRYMSVAPWGKLIKNSLIQKYSIRFDEVPVANDVMFSLVVGHNAKKISVSDILMYIVTVRDGSLVTTKNSELLRCRFEIALKENAFLLKSGKSFFQGCLLPLALKAGKNYGFAETVWYLKAMRKSRVGLFCGYRRRLVMKIVRLINEIIN